MSKLLSEDERDIRLGIQPPKYGERKDAEKKPALKQISIKLDSEQVLWLRRLSNQHGRSISELVRLSVDFYRKEVVQVNHNGDEMIESVRLPLTDSDK